MAKSKQNQQTGKTVLEKRRLKQARRAVESVQRRKADRVRQAS